MKKTQIFVQMHRTTLAIIVKPIGLSSSVFDKVFLYCTLPNK